ncbi:MAG: CCA tRNA nucleotidyltransferase, partial [Pannonibacter indicus]
TALPQQVMERADAAGLKAVPTGIDHGTVTVISSGEPFEVTTLREDVETFGRHAVVRFGRDWAHDAARRDFTMNALYCGADGTIHDPLGGGLEDCLARRVRFIGRAEDRIREDYLRILRFFRFHATYGAGPTDDEGLSASVRLRDGLTQLSAERIGAEMKKILAVGACPPVIAVMEGTGILPLLTGGVARLASLAALKSLSDELPEAGSPILALACLTGFVGEDAGRIARRWRLSNQERSVMFRAIEGAASLLQASDPAAVLKAQMLAWGRETAQEALVLAHARTRSSARDEAGFAGLHELARNWDIPVFPVTGHDLITAGVPKGPALGSAMEHLRRLWAASDYRAARDELLAALPVE